MKKNDIKKMAITLAMLEALTLSGCKSNNIENVKLDSPVKQLLFVVNPLKKEDVDLNTKNYQNISEEHNIMDIVYNTNLYNEKGYKIGENTDYKRIKAIKTNGIYTEIELENNTHVYVDANSLIEVPKLNNSEYHTINEYKEKVCIEKTLIYDANGRYIGYDYDNSLCTAIASNDEYTLVKFKDGKEGFVLSSSIKNAYAKQNKYAYIRCGTPCYYDKELTMQIKTIPADHITYVYVDDDNVAYIGENDYKENYYVRSNELEYIENYNDIYNYGYINNDTPLYSSKELQVKTDTLDKYSLIYIYNIGENNWVSIYDFNHEKFGFIKLDQNNISLLNKNFIDIDLGKQKMICYLDNVYQREYGTRSGKDSTPSHEGVFDIDWKAENWEFTTYRGSYAKHWIPYNEFGEGIHDLVGDDEQNYGNEAYHQYGSHGCIRVPSEASEFIYNNYDVGTQVLVHK